MTNVKCIDREHLGYFVNDASIQGMTVYTLDAKHGPMIDCVKPQLFDGWVSDVEFRELFGI